VNRRRRISICGALVAALASAAVPVALATAGHRANEDGEVQLNMGKPAEFSLRPSVRSAAAGEVAFKVRNAGKIEHEFVILKTPTKAARLKARPGAPSEVVEPGFLVELEDMQPGDRANLVMPLKRGHYVLLCNKPGHFKGGMRSDFVVR
jgi:uncharacterized cupredoxin-like copper-binding protein